MAHRYRISKKTRELIDAAKSALEDERAEHRDSWDNATERYQEGERGQAADTWIYTFDEVIGALEEFQDEPEYGN